jgi:hypothetical protein
MKRMILSGMVLLLLSATALAQEQAVSRKWGAELNVLWPIFPGNMYKGQLTYESWRKGDLAGDVFAGFHIKPTEFREDEGYWANYALTFGYRQFFWKGLHLEWYNAIGPGFNWKNAVDGKDYQSWDYEIGLLAGYRWEFLKQEKRDAMRFSPYISTQHGFFYVAAQSNPHPIRNSTGESAVYVGTLNIGLRF